MTSCWHEDDGETYKWSKPEHMAAQTAEEALGQLGDAFQKAAEKGDTILINQYVELPLKPFNMEVGYKITIKEMHLVWETMPGKDADRWGPIANYRMTGACTVTTIDETPLVVEIQTESELYFKSTREWGWTIYDEPQTRLLSGRMHIKVSGGYPDDTPTEFSVTKNAQGMIIEKNGREEQW